MTEGCIVVVRKINKIGTLISLAGAQVQVLLPDGYIWSGLKSEIYLEKAEVEEYSIEKENKDE